MKVEITRDNFRLNFGTEYKVKGEIAEVADSVGKTLIEQGYAKEIQEVKVKGENQNGN